MGVCLYQCGGALLQVDANLEEMGRVAEAARLQGAKLVIIPELFLCGYNLGDDAPDVADTLDGASVKRSQEIATRSGVALIYGDAERDGASIYNSAIFIDHSGAVLGNYRKVHLFGAES